VFIARCLVHSKTIIETVEQEYLSSVV